MNLENSMRLNVNGVKHVLSGGIFVLGSSKNERYNTILVDDKSICPKHASIRYDATSAKLEVMDLCSIRGVTVDQRPIEALTWCKITTLSKVLLGTVPVFVEKNVPRAEDVKDKVSFLEDEDSRDFIDCSLEETQPLPTTKRATVSSRLLSGSQTGGNSVTAATGGRISNSFYIPATQQLEDSAISTVANESLPPVKSCDISVSSTSTKPVPAANADVSKKRAEDELDDDDDFFIIPETQQPVEDERFPSPPIDRIPPVVLRLERAERTQAEEDYFQMTVQDDENSNDGLFNNEYVQESQNLLQNMDESYRTRMDAAGSRKSILPERSVDSISFQEHRNTTQDMSRLEWNETRAEQDSVEKKKPYAGDQEENPTKEDDRSVTPELHFDVVATVEPPDREGSVTPEVDFDQVVEIKPPEGRSKLKDDDDDDDDDEHEISLNQEGCIPKPVERDAKENGDKKPAEGGVYDIETQALDFDCFKTPSTAMATKSLSKSKSKENGVSPYDMETQALSFDDDDPADPYDLLTQPMEPPKWSVFNKPPKRSESFVEPKGPEPEDFQTQPMIPPDSLRRAFSKAKSNEPQPSTSSARTTLPLDPADIETQPMSPPERFKTKIGPPSPSIDPADLLTQPMSPPRNLREDSCSPLWKKPVSKLFDAYDQATQPLGTSPERKEATDPYAMQTQLMQPEDDHKSSSYDLLTQPLQRSVQGSSSLRKTDTVGLAAHEISHFEPMINSTVRHSLLQAGTQTKDTKQHQTEEQISPTSSNKENQTHHRGGVSSSEEEFDEEEEEDLDDDMCLAATLPVGELGKESKKRGRGRPPKEPPSGFKVPSDTTLTTPKPAPNKSRREPIVVTEFLTPEHPLLSLPKPDSILMASVHMRELSASHSRETAAQGGPKYHFKDDSSDDEDADRLVFKKSHVSVALERELEKVKEVSNQKKLEMKEKEGSKKRAVKKEEPRDEDEESPKKRRVTVEKASSTSSCSSATSRHTSEQQTKGKEPGKKTSREKSVKKEELVEKESSRGKDGKRKEKATSSSTLLPIKEDHHPIEGSERVSTRSHREPRPKQAIDESVAYEASTSKTTEATVRASTRTRKPREIHSPERRQLKEPEEKPVADGAMVPRRESKRQKTINYKYRSNSPDPVPVQKKKPTDTRERPRRTTTITKKVDDPSSSTVSGLLRGELGLPSEERKDAVVDVSVTSSTGSEGSIRMARANRPKLIFTRMSPEPYRKCIARAGGKVVDIPELANVLVTDRIFRTYKFLCAVAKGIPIVGQSYLDALQAAQEHDDPVDPWEHILCDEISEKRYKFSLRDSLLKARGHKLFQDYTVFVTSNTQPPPLELYLILSCAGATPMKHASQSVKQSGKMFVISDPSDAASWPKYREKYPNIDVVSTEGFMLSIMQHSISLKKHRLL